MAETAHSSSNHAVLRYAFLTVLLLISVAGAYRMRIHPIQAGIPIDFDESVARGQFPHPSENVPPITLRKDYTGIEGIDRGLLLLVAAFISGPAAIEDRIWYQQLHFLAGFAPILGVWTIESCRKRWRGCGGIRCTSIWATFYQTIGGAVIVPLYPLYFIFKSRPGPTTKSFETYLAHGQEVDAATSWALIPSMLLGYVIPTALMYVPRPGDLETTMGLVALWQISPLIVNALVTVLTYLFSKFITTNTRPRSSIGQLHLYYAMLVSFAASAHLFVSATIYQSSSPWTIFSSIFIPDFADALSSTSAGLHNIFQWDWLLIALSQLVWALYALIEVKLAGIDNFNLVVAVVLLISSVPLVGPGAAVACVWWWRESILIQFANRGLKKE